MVTVLIKQKLNKSYNMIIEDHEETKGNLIMQISQVSWTVHDAYS